MPFSACARPDPVRIATYNVEWFDTLFDEAGALLNDSGRSARHGVTRAGQIAALGHVFRAVDADAVMVIEAPDHSRNRSTVTALERFAAHHRLRTSAALIGFANDSQQEIALLYDPARVTARHDPGGSEPAVPSGDPDPPFDRTMHFADPEKADAGVRFAKPPLEVTLTLPGGELRLIGVHLKSKAPYGTRSKAEAVQVSIANRRKQLAQSLWLRRRVDGHLAAGHALVVLGDFNDGPGLDEYEKLFGRSGLEVVLGWDRVPDLQLYDPHARLWQGRGASPASSRFYVAQERRYLSAMLDYVMVSPDLRALKPVWRIWHPFDDPGCYGDPALREALLAASDHFPVTLDLSLAASPAGESGL